MAVNGPRREKTPQEIFGTKRRPARGLATPDQRELDRPASFGSRVDEYVLWELERGPGLWAMRKQLLQ